MDGIDLKIAIELSPFKVRFSRVGKEILEIVINLEACKAAKPFCWFAFLTCLELLLEKGF